MFQYSNRRMGGMTRWWRRRRLAALTIVADPASLGALVPPNDPPAAFTPAEDAEVAEGYSSQRTIEADYHRSLRKQLRRLAERAPQLERRKVAQLRLGDDARESDERDPPRRRARTGDARPRSSPAARCPGGPRRAARRRRCGGLPGCRRGRLRHVRRVAGDHRLLPPRPVVAGDGARGDVRGRTTQGVALGRRPPTRRSGHRRRTTNNTPDGSGDRRASPRCVGALGLLIAGAALRVYALFEVPQWFWLAVPAFSASALAGAFFVEYTWASKPLDERDDLERRSRRVHRRLRRADRKLASVEGDYRSRQAEIEQLWSVYEPAWRVQMEMAAARIAAARAEHPELFHPLGPSVVESIHDRIARGTTRRDAKSGLDDLHARCRPSARARAQRRTGRAGRLRCRRPFLRSATARRRSIGRTVGEPPQRS